MVHKLEKYFKQQILMAIRIFGLVWGARPRVGPAEAPWQQALAERHGAVLAALEDPVSSRRSGAGRPADQRGVGR